MAVKDARPRTLVFATQASGAACGSRVRERCSGLVGACRGGGCVRVQAHNMLLCAWSAAMAAGIAVAVAGFAVRGRRSFRCAAPRGGVGVGGALGGCSSD